MRAKWIVVVLGVCAVVTAVAMAYAAGRATSEVPEVIRAHRFELVDMEGTAWAVLGFNALGNPEVQFLDAAGEVSAPEVIRAQKFEVVDARGSNRASLGLRGLRLTGPDGKGRIGLVVQGDGTPVVGISDNKGRPRFGLEARPDGSVNLALHAGDPHVRAILRLDSEGQPSLQLLDRENVPRAVLGASVIGRVRAGATGKTPESSLVLLDENGEVVWKAP